MNSYLGFRAELENRVGDAKGKGTSGDPTRLKVRCTIRGALPRRSEEAG